jgi:hypothetical protein
MQIAKLQDADVCTRGRLPGIKNVAFGIWLLAGMWCPGLGRRSEIGFFKDLDQTIGHVESWLHHGISCSPQIQIPRSPESLASGLSRDMPAHSNPEKMMYRDLSRPYRTIILKYP